MKTKSILVILTLTCIANVFYAQVNDGSFSSLKENFYKYIESEIKRWQVPGLAIGIVKDDAVIISEGFGVRKAGEKHRINENTKFLLGSCSKIFTNTAIALLEERRLLDIHRPMHEMLPGFAFCDPWISQNIATRDFLIQNTGLKTWQGECLWKLGFSREEIIFRMRFIKPEYSFRSRFGYSNLSYIVLSELIASVSEMSWEDFIEAQIFAPLSMNDSDVTSPDFNIYDNIAMPHIIVRDSLQGITYPSIENVIPAGGASSTVENLCKFVRCILNKGKLDHSKIFSKNTIKEMCSPQIIIPKSEKTFYSLFPENANDDFLMYGYGWFIHDYQHKKVVENIGNIPGTCALISMMPELKLGIVILANAEVPLLLSALRLKIFDYFLNLPNFDWSSEFFKAFQGQRQEYVQNEEFLLQNKNQNTDNKLPNSAYVGVYNSKVYGNLTIREESGNLMISVGKRPMTGFITHWHYNSFRIRWDLPFLMRKVIFATFSEDQSGKIVKVQVPPMGSFKRIR